MCCVHMFLSAVLIFHTTSIYGFSDNKSPWLQASRWKWQVEKQRGGTAYEPVQVCTLIWWPQRCKNSSPMIWSWWYPNPGSKKPSWSQLSDGVSCLSWGFVIFMAKNGFVSRNGKKKKRFFFAAVKLHCLTSENKLFHNLWWNGWILMISGMLGPSTLQWLWPSNLLSFFW